MKKTLVFIITLLSIALFCGFFIFGYKMGQNKQRYKDQQITRDVINTIKPIRENNFNYKYIFPLLAYDFGQAFPYMNDGELDAKLKKFVEEQTAQGSVDQMSIYVRNFFDNRWAGVNQDIQYNPGSLLKVLIMMAYYREAQLDPSKLNQSFVYTNDINIQANAVPYSLPTNLKIGKSYSVTELLEAMIANSDNGAETLLINNVDRQILNNAYNDLNIPNPDSMQGDYTISTRQYAAFLRILYNSTYLTENFSNVALSIMAKSTFKEGISAGVPKNIEIAQKYGERLVTEGSQVQSIELHDCGIVYAPDHPYTICVMTKGKDENKLKATISAASKLIYEYISNQH